LMALQGPKPFRLLATYGTVETVPYKYFAILTHT
jgi:hypothetical protein